MAGAERRGLIGLLDDLLHDGRVRAEFNQCSEALMDAYELTKFEKYALNSMQTAKIGLGVVSQLDGYPFPEGEFPVVNENFLAPEAGTLLYPAPTPKLFRVRPLQVEKSRLGAKKVFELNIYGQSLPSYATCQLVDERTGKALKVKATQVIGTFRCAHLCARVKAKHAGQYTVTVSTNPDDLSTNVDLPFAEKVVVF